MDSGALFIISAPSGAGKTTILKEIMRLTPQLAFSVSHTTRKQRSGEREGIDYHFVERDAFLAMREAGIFLEWAEVHGNLYGTSRTVVTELLQQGVDVILDIDVQGARQVRESGMQAHFLFIVPPSWQELKRRLAGRLTEDEETLQRRLSNAGKELAEASRYDYLIVNDQLEAAVEMVRAIIIATRARAFRSADGRALTVCTPGRENE